MGRLLGYVLSGIVGMVGGAVTAIAIEQFYGDALRRAFAEWAAAGAAMQPSDWDALLSAAILVGLWVAVGILLLVHLGGLLVTIYGLAVTWRNRAHVTWAMSIRGLIGSGSGLTVAILSMRTFGLGLVGAGLAVLFLLIFGLVTSLVITALGQRDDLKQAQHRVMRDRKRWQVRQKAERTAKEREAREQRAARARDIAAVRESVSKKVRVQGAARHVALMRKIDRTVSRGSAALIEEVMAHINESAATPRRRVRSGVRLRHPSNRRRRRRTTG